MITNSGEENNNYEPIKSEYNLLPKTFFWMFLGLISTAFIAAYTYYSGFFESILMEGYFEILLILELVVVLLFSFLFRKLSPTVVRNTILYICCNKWCYYVSYFCSI